MPRLKTHKNKQPSLAISFNEKLQKYKDEYVKETEQERYTTIDLARWAMSTGRWEPPPDLALRKCREDFANALRTEYIEGDDGLPVRVNHAVRECHGDRQRTFWSDIDKMPRDELGRSNTQKREQIVGECRQIDRDERYFNSHHPDEDPLAMLFDFTDDVIEGRYSGKMRDPPSDD
jgi:hypothetical protein